MISLLAYIAVIIALALWVEALPLKVRRAPADELEGWLKNFQWGSRSELGEKLDLPIYKFYTEIIEVLLNLARRMGGSYQGALLFLREGLQNDRQFEKKMRETILGCWLQMIMTIVLTWAFILGSLTLVDVKFSWITLGLIAGWQGLGLLLLPLTISYLRRRLFGDLGKLWRLLYILSSLARVPLSRTEIFAMAGVQDLKSIRSPKLQHLVDKIMLTCQEALKLGKSYEDEVKYLMEELRFQEKWHFELFEKRLTALKLVLMSVFFLPSYLGFIFLLLGDLVQSL